MYWFVISLLFTYTAAYNYDNFIPYKPSAASESQIKFAIENKYDDTGPGAKKPETAYNTYSNLVDALVGYIDDPDTKLPAHEKAIAVDKLLNAHDHTIHVNHVYAPTSLFSKFYEPKKSWHGNQEVFHKIGAKVDENPLIVNSFAKGSPLNLAHYFREKAGSQGLHDHHPRYSYAYNVHDNNSGDSKLAQESRDGGNVIGFYSFKDADGKTRTVHYTAYGKEGFKAVVQSLRK